MKTMAERSKEHLRNQAKGLCEVFNCPHYRERGYVLCVGHLHGFPNRASDEVLEFAGRKKQTMIV